MLRSRILAAATAAVLMLGISVGGAGAAFAESEDGLNAVDETAVVETPTETPAEPVVEPEPEPVADPEVEPVVQPAAMSATVVTTRVSSGPSFAPATTPAGLTVTVDGPNPFTCNSAPRNYQKPDDWNSSDNLLATEEWGTATWSENGSFSWTINPGYDVNLCIKGGRTIVEIDTSVFDGSSYAFKDLQGSGISHAGFIVIPTVASASITPTPADCDYPTRFITSTGTISNATWGAAQVSGNTITIVATRTGGALFPLGAGVSENRTTKTFTAAYSPADESLCPPDVASAAVSVLPPTCELGTRFVVNLEESDNVSWGDPVISGNTITIVATADEGAEFAEGDGVSDDGSTKTFTAPYSPADESLCPELGTVVVPVVTETDFCEGAGPNAVRVATFTVQKISGVVYRYTVNGVGPAELVVFPEGEDEVTIPVSPLDVVVVTATALEDFELDPPAGWVDNTWTHTFIEAGFCPGTFPATIAAADISPADCDGSPVLVKLTNEPGVIWILNSEEVDGNMTHELVPGSAVALTASLEDDYTWNDPDQQTSWSNEGMADEDCLSNLAFTGSNSATEWLGAAAVIMMLVGMGAVIRRRSVTA